MKVFVLAVIGAACSSVAFAGEVKQTKTVAPIVKATTMSDSDMDKVTGGAVDLIHTDGLGGPLGDQHHGTGGTASNMHSFENGAVNNIQHIFK